MPATRRLGWTIQPTSDCGIERRVTRYETTTTGRAHARPAERPRDAHQAGTRKLAPTHTQGRCDVERLDGNRSRAFDRPPGRYGRGRDRAADRQSLQFRVWQLARPPSFR